MLFDNNLDVICMYIWDANNPTTQCPNFSSSHSGTIIFKDDKRILQKKKNHNTRLIFPHPQFSINLILKDCNLSKT